MAKLVHYAMIIYFVICNLLVSANQSKEDRTNLNRNLHLNNVIDIMLLVNENIAIENRLVKSYIYIYIKQ